MRLDYIRFLTTQINPNFLFISTLFVRWITLLHTKATGSLNIKLVVAVIVDLNSNWWCRLKDWPEAGVTFIYSILLYTVKSHNRIVDFLLSKQSCLNKDILESWKFHYSINDFYTYLCAFEKKQFNLKMLSVHTSVFQTLLSDVGKHCTFLLWALCCLALWQCWGKTHSILKGQITWLHFHSPDYNTESTFSNVSILESVLKKAVVLDKKSCLGVDWRQN